MNMLYVYAGMMFITMLTIIGSVAGVVLFMEWREEKRRNRG